MCLPGQYPSEGLYSSEFVDGRISFLASLPALKERNPEASTRQIDAGRQATRTGADHNGVLGAHATPNLLRSGRVTTRW